MNKLPYNCKELINLYALNKLSNYETLQEFNKICDYKSCEYSNLKLRTAEKYYRTQKERHNRSIEKLVKDAFIKKNNVESGIIGPYGNLAYIYRDFYDDNLFGKQCYSCHKRCKKYYLFYFGKQICELCAEQTYSFKTLKDRCVLCNDI